MYGLIRVAFLGYLLGFKSCALGFQRIYCFGKVCVNLFQSQIRSQQCKHFVLRSQQHVGAQHGFGMFVADGRAGQAGLRAKCPPAFFLAAKSATNQ